MNKKTFDQLIIKTDEKNKNLIIVKEKLRIFALNYGINDNFWAFKSIIKKVQVSDWYSVDDIVNISLIENSVSKTKGNLGKIIATGLLFGPIGAVAGSIPTGSNRIDKIILFIITRPINIILETIYSIWNFNFKIFFMVAYSYSCA
jgi:hypothetical protein